MSKEKEIIFFGDMEKHVVSKLEPIANVNTVTVSLEDFKRILKELSDMFYLLEPDENKRNVLRDFILSLQLQMNEQTGEITL